MLQQQQQFCYEKKKKTIHILHVCCVCLLLRTKERKKIHTLPVCCICLLLRTKERKKIHTLPVCCICLLLRTSHEAGTETVKERQKSSRRFPINLPTPLLKRNRQPSTQQDSMASSQPQRAHSNQSSNNPGTDPHIHSFMLPSYSAGVIASSSPGPAMALTAASNVATSAALASSVMAGGQRACTARAGADPQGPSASAVDRQQSWSGEATRKKAPRELTSFPPYTSPQSERSEPLPAKASSLVTSERPPQQGQGQGERPSQKPEPVAGEEAGSGEGQSAPQPVDYGPMEALQPIAEGWSLWVCPCGCVLVSVSLSVCLWVCPCHCVLVSVSLWVCPCPCVCGCVLVGMSLCVCPCWCVLVHVSLSMCPCLCVLVGRTQTPSTGLQHPSSNHCHN